MQAQERSVRSAPQTLCGYEFVRWLKEGRTALCLSGQRRQIVLKVIDDDCLLDGQLHPDIKERLARIRELPHRNVATLISVERDEDGQVYGIWEYIEGTSFLSWLCDQGHDERMVARMLRELVLTVEAMHGHGIIHGALHDGNILIDTSGEVRLLDVSPLLHVEEGVDAAAIGQLIGQVLAERRRTGEPGAILSQISPADDLRQISVTINRAILAGEQMEESGEASPAVEDEQEVRRRAMRWALACAVLALVLGVVTWWSFSDSTKAPPEPPAEAFESRGE